MFSGTVTNSAWSVEARTREDPLTRRDRIDPGPYRLDFTRDLVADHARDLRRVRVEPGPRHRIGKVDPCRLHRDPHLTGPYRRVRSLLDLQDLGASGLVITTARIDATTVRESDTRRARSATFGPLPRLRSVRLFIALVAAALLVGVPAGSADPASGSVPERVAARTVVGGPWLAGCPGLAERDQPARTPLRYPALYNGATLQLEPHFLYSVPRRRCRRTPGSCGERAHNLRAVGQPQALDCQRSHFRIASTPSVRRPVRHLCVTSHRSRTGLARGTGCHGRHR